MLRWQLANPCRYVRMIQLSEVPRGWGWSWGAAEANIRVVAARLLQLLWDYDNAGLQLWTPTSFISATHSRWTCRRRLNLFCEACWAWRRHPTVLIKEPFRVGKGTTDEFSTRTHALSSLHDSKTSLELQGHLGSQTTIDPLQFYTSFVPSPSPSQTPNNTFHNPPKKWAPLKISIPVELYPLLFLSFPAIPHFKGCYSHNN